MMYASRNIIFPERTDMLKEPVQRNINLSYANVSYIVFLFVTIKQLSTFAYLNVSAMA